MYEEVSEMLASLYFALADNILCVIICAVIVKKYVGMSRNLVY